MIHHRRLVVNSDQQRANSSDGGGGQCPAVRGALQEAQRAHEGVCTSEMVSITVWIEGYWICC